MTGMDDIAPFVRDLVREELSRRRTMAEVVSVDGIEVTVRRTGYTTVEGPYATRAGAAGFLRPGMIVPLITDFGGFIVDYPVEPGPYRANMMQLVGIDSGYQATDRVGEDRLLLEVDGLEIGPDARAQFDFHVLTSGGAGATLRSVKVALNDGTPYNLNMDPTSPQSSTRQFVSAYVSTYPSDMPSPERAMYFQYNDLAAAVSDPQERWVARDVEVINSIQVYGYVDTSGDTVGAAQLVVFS